MKKLLIFHPTIAPYRVDFFNKLNLAYETRTCLNYSKLLSQKTFDYTKISNLFNFSPKYLYKEYNFILFKLKRGIISEICEFKPDIILVSEFGYIAVLVILFKFLSHSKYKVISIVDDSYDMIINNNQFSIRHNIMEKFLVPFIDNVINVEPEVVKYFQEKYSKGIFFPIIQDENTIRLNYKDALDISKKYIEKYRLNDKKILLFVGRLVRIKNIDFVIKAFLSLNDKRYKLIIVGEGSYESTLKESVQKNENIIFTGHLQSNELYAWYNIAELFVLASIQEPFGAVTNEALLGGCFCLISNNAGSKCLIKDGVNGYTFDPYDDEKFANMLRRSFNDIPIRQYPLLLRGNRMMNSFKYYFNNLINKIDSNGN